MAKNYVDGKCVSCGQVVRVYFVEESSAGSLRNADPEDVLELDLEEDLFCGDCDPNGTVLHQSIRQKSG